MSGFLCNFSILCNDMTSRQGENGEHFVQIKQKIYDQNYFNECLLSFCNTLNIFAKTQVTWLSVAKNTFCMKTFLSRKQKRDSSKKSSEWALLFNFSLSVSFFFFTPVFLLLLLLLLLFIWFNDYVHKNNNKLACATTYRMLTLVLGLFLFVNMSCLVPVVVVVSWLL